MSKSINSSTVNIYSPVRNNFITETDSAEHKVRTPAHSVSSKESGLSFLFFKADIKYTLLKKKLCSFVMSKITNRSTNPNKWTPEMSFLSDVECEHFNSAHAFKWCFFLHVAMRCCLIYMLSSVIYFYAFRNKYRKRHHLDLKKVLNN